MSNSADDNPYKNFRKGGKSPPPKSQRRPRRRDARDDRDGDEGGGKKSGGSGIRATSVRVILAVLNGQSLDAALAEHRGYLNDRDQAWVRAASNGVLRDWRLLNTLLRGCLSRPEKPPQDVLCALGALGIYQLRSMRIPSHAAVSATVDACYPLGQGKARGFVNAVLRQYLRQQESLQKKLADESSAIRYSHPTWLVEMIEQDWGERSEQVLAANQERAPMVLRVDTNQISRSDYVKRLQQADITAEPHPDVESALVLDVPVSVASLPEFSKGLVSIQDAGAQLAGQLLQPKTGERVLDACAAPGGKTMHLAQLAQKAKIVALDSSAERLKRVKENLLRTNCLNVKVIEADAATPEVWWDGQHFDHILLDAPCSGSGVIRRHPDIKWLRRESDIPDMAAQQLQLLEKLWPTLKSGGQLVYVTCSILTAENEDVVAQFLAKTADATSLPTETGLGETATHGRRIMPGYAADGFYYALLQKAS